MPNKERAWLIPSDWTPGQAWAGFCIQWPDSFEWKLMLRSLMYTLTRGREWDRDSGVIKDAQAIGWDIFERNHDLLVGCDISGQPSVVYLDRVVYVGCNQESEDIDMANCGPIPFETREDGLYYYHCCQWVKIWPGSSDSDGTIVPDLGDEPLVPPGGDPATYYACGKASAAVDLLFDVASTAWVTGTMENPQEYLHIFHTAFPQLHGGDIEWIDACVLAWQVNGLFSPETVYPDDLKALMKCRLSEQLEDDAAGMTDDDYKYLSGVMQDYFPLASNSLNVYIIRF